MPYDRILLHPNIAAKADGAKSLERKEERSNARFKGAVIGASTGLAAALALKHILPRTTWGQTARSLKLVDKLTSPSAVQGAMTLGGGIGFSAGLYNEFNDKLRRHTAAVRELETTTGQAAPFAVAHPYLGNVLPSLTGAALGAYLAGPGVAARSLGAGAGFLTAGLTVTPFVSNALQAKREDYLKRYQLEKPAATALADPRLLHPGLVERPQSAEESAKRREENLNFLGVGATTGGLLGLAAAHALLKKNPAALADFVGREGADLSKRVYAAGGLGGVLGGAVAGIAAAPTARMLARIKKHDDAVHTFERQTGERIPFAARHPYLMTAGPVLAAAAYGAARPHRFFPKGTTFPTNVAARGFGALTNAALAGTTLAPIGNAISHNERMHYFKGRVPTLNMDRYGLSAVEELHTADEIEKMRKVETGELSPSEIDF